MTRRRAGCDRLAACLTRGVKPSPSSSPDRLPVGDWRARAPARLHLGFIDPAATIGRRWGSIGLVLDAPASVLQLRAAAADEIVSPGTDERQRIAAHLQALRAATGLRAPLRIELAQALPAHAGLGSGTQLALAVGRAFCRAFGRAFDVEPSTAELAALLGRGARSGIGSAGFDHGGFLVDGGPAADGSTAPVLFRAGLPADWRVLLVQDPRARGLHGDDEQRALAALPPFPREHAARIAHQLLMRVLPAIAERDFAPFAAGLSEIQRLIGAHFAPAQGGDAWTSAPVGRLLRWIEEKHAAGVGQSSWGPTGFALLPSPHDAQRALDAARAAGMIDARLQISITGARNRGADIDRIDEPQE